MNVKIKLHAQGKSVHLSRQSIERYVNYKLDKILNKPYLKNHINNVTLYVDQREKTESTVKILVEYDKKEIVALSHGDNPYKLIKDTLSKLERKLKKVKETQHNSSAFRAKQNAEKEKTRDDYIETYDALLEEDSDFDNLNDFADDMCDSNYSPAEEDLFEKLIRNF